MVHGSFQRRNALSRSQVCRSRAGGSEGLPQAQERSGRQAPFCSRPTRVMRPGDASPGKLTARPDRSCDQGTGAQRRQTLSPNETCTPANGGFSGISSVCRQVHLDHLRRNKKGGQIRPPFFHHGNPDITLRSYRLTEPAPRRAPLPGALTPPARPHCRSAA